MHNPEILILDEPTTGLDPNQLREIRTLIKSISHEKAVILSTHIMQEVAALCDDVLLISQGKMVFYDSLAKLALQNRQQLIVAFEESIDKVLLESIPGVETVRTLSHGQYLLDVKHREDIRARVFQFAKKNDLTLLQLEEHSGCLEKIFQKLTDSNM